MYTLKVNDRSFSIDPEQDMDWDLLEMGGGKYSILHKGKSYEAQLVSLDRDEKKVTLQINGKKYIVEVQTKMDQLLAKMGMTDLATSKIKDLKAPMPGLVLDIKVKVGDVVAKGDPLMVLEAMKMENVIKASGEGTVGEIKVKKGEAVDKGELLIGFQ